MRSLVDARLPPRLLSYLAGEVSQLFKLDLNGGELNEEHVKQLKSVLWLMTSSEQQRPMDFLLNAISFVAELNENLDLQGLQLFCKNLQLHFLGQLNQILEPLTICLDLEASKIVQHILKRSFLEVLACRRLAQSLFERPEAKTLRSELFRQLDSFEELLDFKSAQKTDGDAEMRDEAKMDTDEVIPCFNKNLLLTNMFSQKKILTTSFFNQLNYRLSVYKYKLTVFYCV